MVDLSRPAALRPASTPSSKRAAPRSATKRRKAKAAGRAAGRGGRTGSSAGARGGHARRAPAGARSITPAPPCEGRGNPGPARHHRLLDGFVAAHFHAGCHAHPGGGEKRSMVRRVPDPASRRTKPRRPGRRPRREAGKPGDARGRDDTQGWSAKYAASSRLPSGGSPITASSTALSPSRRRTCSRLASSRRTLIPGWLATKRATRWGAK